MIGGSYKGMGGRFGVRAVGPRFFDLLLPHDCIAFWYGITQFTRQHRR